MLQLQNIEILTNGAFAARESNGTNMVLSWRYYSMQAKVHSSFLSSDNAQMRKPYIDVVFITDFPCNFIPL